MLKVAVITPSVNTEYLIRAIKSVQNQTLECKHYVVNDGKDDFSWGGESVINLPENTGRADGVIWNGHRIYAGLPFMLNADYVIFFWMRIIGLMRTMCNQWLICANPIT